MEIKSASEFQSIIENEKKLVVVDFYATWCGPCKMLSPILEEVADELKNEIVMIKIDIDKFGEISKNYFISSVPTLLFFKNGEKVGEEVGYKPKDDLIDLIKTEYLK